MGQTRQQGLGHAAASLFPVVGIGAACAGIAGLELLLRKLPRDTGAAYLIVLHNEPSRVGQLLKDLRRAAVIPVQPGRAGVRVLPNYCYVIAPSSNLSLVQGVLVSQPGAHRRKRTPIDAFFRALSRDQRERVIAVILSGTGHDGRLGLRAVTEAAGAVFATKEGSATEAGCADVVAPLEELPTRILSYLAHMPGQGRPAIEDDAQSALEQVYLLLRAQTGHDFFYYKHSTIERRVERRMSLLQLDSLERYLMYLHENPTEIRQLFKDLLIGVTSFFRDPLAWKALQREVLPGLIANHTGSGLRAWVAGCSTGEEAYSLAMAFCELADRKDLAPRIQIFATDLDVDAIETARAGLYPEGIAADVAPARLRRFFVREEHGYRVSSEIRELVVFAPQNMIMDPPFTRLDILCCRNFLIYLSAGLQSKLLPVFHYCLNPDGVLFLGSADAVGHHGKLFRAIDSESRIYRSQAQPALVRPFELQCALQLASGSGLSSPPTPRDFTVSSERFTDGSAQRPRHARQPEAQSRIAELEQELLCAREEAQTLREEMQSSRKELELANRNLYSANQQLLGSHEELRSLNEELQAINQELQFRLDELAHSHSDIKNLMDSTEVAILFVDLELRVRRFTAPMAKIFKLVASDTGRLITDLAHDLRAVDVAREARKVLRTLLPLERQCAARDGRFFVMRILPYRTLEQVIDGVVITFADATASRALVTDLRGQISRLRQQVEQRSSRSN